MHEIRPPASTGLIPAYFQLQSTNVIKQHSEESCTFILCRHHLLQPVLIFINVFVCVQELKDKKQTEEAENGEDAAANGKTVRTCSCSLQKCSTVVAITSETVLHHGRTRMMLSRTTM